MIQLPGFFVDFTPRNGNGSRYPLHIVQDRYGGWIVVWSNVCTWRYYSPRYCHSDQGELKFMSGTFNRVDTLAVLEFLDGRHELA